MPTIINADTSDGLKLTSDTSGEIEFQSAGSTKVTMDTTGNVGIGTSSPTNRLQLSSTGNPGLILEGTNQGSNLKKIRLASQLLAAGDFAIQSMNDNDTVKSTNLYIDSSSNLKFNSGYGSVATAYGCRAWVNFNGTGTVAIRDSGNVSSITDNGTGDYTVNFTTAMPDSNYAIIGSAQGLASGSDVVHFGVNGYSGSPIIAPATTNCKVGTFAYSGAGADSAYVMVGIFR